MTTGSVGFVLALVLFGPAGQPTQQAAKLVTQMGQTGQVQVWVVDALDNVLRTDTPPQNPAQEIVLEAARGEYESGQVVVRSSQPISGLRATATALEGPKGAQIEASQLRCRFVGYVHVEKNTPHTPDEELVAKAPGEFPDPLLEDETMNVPANTSQPVWLTVHVPDDAAPGQYTGQIRLSWDGGERTIPIRLTVWPFNIPRERHLYFTNWISVGAICKRYSVEAYSEEFWRIFEKFAANCAEHRQNILWVSPRVVKCYREPDGHLTFDFSIFDRWVQTCEKYGVADLIEISQLGGFKSGWGGKEIVLRPVPVTDRKTGKTEQRPAEEVLPHFLKALQEHLREKGWLKKTVLHIADEPSINNYKSWCEKSDWVHQYAPEIRRIDAIEAPDFGNSLEVWVPKLSHFRTWRPYYERARKRGAELWFYTCCHPFGRYPNRFVDYPLIKTRILHWINWRYDLKGYLHWGLLAWSDDPFKSVTRGHLPPGDCWIVYPGKDGPIDSIRWETLRDGIEDYEYLWLLTSLAEKVKKQLGKAAEGFDSRQLADALCAQAVPEILDYVRDSEKLWAIRRRIAQEIISLSSPPPLLVWTVPPEGQAVAMGPAVAVLYVAALPGTKVIIGDQPVELDENGLYARNVNMVVPGRQLTITATAGGNTKTVVRVFKCEL